MPKTKTNTKTKTHSSSNRTTRGARLLRLLADGKWHSTKELIRRVGHTFAGAKFHLARKGYLIEVRPHPKRRRQYQYRLVRRRSIPLAGPIGCKEPTGYRTL